MVQGSRKMSLSHTEAENGSIFRVLVLSSSKSHELSKTFRSFNNISASLKRSNEVLNKLFPSTPVESLASLSHEALVKLVLAPKAHDSKSPVAGEEETDEALEYLEPSPQQEFHFDESTRNQDPGSKVFDDVNGLSLALDDSSSYLGISSISAVLRVINHIAPDFRLFVQQSAAQSNERENTSSRSSIKTQNRQSEPAFVDAYFEHIHCITPIVDEAKFRAKYHKRDDDGSPWLALKNMLLAMGSLCISTKDESSHTIFYNLAYQHLSCMYNFVALFLPRGVHTCQIYELKNAILCRIED